jgi:hypothetical protein
MFCQTRVGQVSASKNRSAIRFLFFTAVSLSIIIFGPTSVYGQQQTDVEGGVERTVDAETRSKIVEELAERLINEYVFPDIGKRMADFVREQLSAGAYDQITSLPEFARILTKDLHSIKEDGHLSVRAPSGFPQFPSGRAESDTESWKASYLAEARYDNFGFRRIELLTGNIGYLDISRFVYPEIDGENCGGEAALAAMTLLSYCNVLIVDLRDSMGGRPEMMQLLYSYLFSKPVHFLTKLDRKKGVNEELWTYAGIPGKSMFDVPMYVLTSRYTRSAAEWFAYILKNRGRATIIGETTSGAGYRAHLVPLPELGVLFSISHGTNIDPLTGESIEGIGVEPNISVPPAEALDTAYIEALEASIEREKNETLRYQMEWALAEAKVKLNPVELDEAVLQEYVGVYEGPRHITLEDGELCFQREGRDKYHLVPMGNDLFKFAEAELFFYRLQFIRDDSGTVIAFKDRWDTGQPSETHERIGY